MLALMRRAALVGTTAIVLSLAGATQASGAIHQFRSDDGTTCNVEVGAKASDSLGALSGPPQVGYSSFPKCTYAGSPASGSGSKGKAKRCKKAKRRAKGSKRKKKKCKRPKRRTYAAVPADRASASAATPLAVLDQARLVLLGPGGEVANVGTATAAAPAFGYSCTVTATSTCGDSGRLMPALPGTTYTAAFSLNLAPPAGETWVTRPSGCWGGAVADCVLRSAGVTPDL